MAASSSIVFVGGKGAILTPDHIYAVSRGLASVQIDESAFEKLLSNTASSRTAPIVSSVAPIRFIRREESRAALLVILNKLVHSDSRGVQSAIPVLSVDLLNRKCEAEKLDFGSVSGFITSLYGLSGKKEPAATTKDEEFVIDNSFGVSNALCGILDCVSSSLVVLLDAVSALSCEAAGLDISSFDLFVSGDGFSVKDETNVAGDLKMLLFGSKLVGKVPSRYSTEIPTVNGSVREAVRLLHLRSRVELNSVIKTRKTPIMVSSGKDNALARLVVHLGLAVSYAGESCLGRIKLNLDSISDPDLKLKMLFALQNGCGVNTTNDTINLDEIFYSLRDVFKLIPTNDTLQSVYDILVKLREVIAWEAAIALFVMEMDISKEVSQSISEGNSGNVKAERKNEKKKKKTSGKAGSFVLGKGTSIIRQMLKENLAIENGNLDVSVLSRWAQELSSFFHPMNARLYLLFDKIKEIVQSNDVRRLPKIPKGTRDFGKEQMAIREHAFSVILGIFKRHGAVGLDTPVFELRETLMGKYGEDSKLIYDLADQGGEICSLRYDLTVPFARYLAMNNITSLKRYQIGKVYRRDNPSKGRYREFYQCDFDIAGQQGKMEPDFEVLKVLTELLDELEIGDYEVKFNHRKLLDGMLEICGVPSEKFRTVCSSIDKLDKQSFDQVKIELVDEKGLTIEVAEKIGSFVKKRGPAFDILSDLTGEGSLFSQNKESILALEELGVLFNALNKANALDKIVFDLSLARGLDYYTGVIFEAVMKGSNQVGSIAAGGRYDNLVGMFSGKQVPAVGISLGIERVFTIMESNSQAGNQEIRSTETQVLVAVLGQDLTIAAEIVAEMWNAKIAAEFGVHKNVMKHIKRAVDGGIPWMVIIGESEQAQGIVKLKDIKANKEETLSRDQIVVELQTRLNTLSLRRYTVV